MSDLVPAVATAALLAAFLLRLLPRLVLPGLQGTDAYYHRAYIRLIRENGHRVPRSNPRILGPGEHSYPALLHWLLAWAPPGVVGFVDRFGGALCDLVAALALAAVLGPLLGSLPAGVALGALYLLAPGLTLLHIGPRAFTLTPRCWAQLLWLLGGLAAMRAATADSPVWFALAALLLGAMMLTSKFAVQNAVFVLPGAAVLTQSPMPLALLAAAGLAALALSGGFFLRQCRGQFDHLRWYYALNRDMVAHRSNWGELAAQARRGDVGGLAVGLLWHNPVTSGLIRHFPLVLALVVALEADGAAPFGGLAGALTAAAVVPWLLTSFGALKILGEAERYLEFAFPFAWILLFAHADRTGDVLATILAAIFLLAYIANLAALWRLRGRLTAADEGDIAAALRARPGAVLLCLSDPESYYFLATTDVRLAKYNGDLSLRGKVGEYLARFFWRYPWVDPDRVEEIAAEAGVDAILLNKRAAERLTQLSGRSYRLDHLPVLAENGTYRLLARGPASAAPGER